MEKHYDELNYNFDRWHREMGANVKVQTEKQDKIDGIHATLVEDVKSFKEYC